MEYIPEDLHRIIRYFHRESKFPNILIKAYSFQILRALAYFQINNICHRDIKPRNILIDLSSHTLRICDFGSAKKLIKG
jgi:glycogen synthase kinase 3 beta